MQDTRVQSLVGKIPWKRKWQPTPVFLPGKSHGLRRLVGYSPWGRKESDTTGQLLLSFFFHFQCRTNDQKQPANRTLKHWDSMLLTALKLIYSRNREKYINICILACCSVAESCPTLCDPVDWSTPGFWVLHCLPEFAQQTHVHWVGELSNHLILCRPLLLLPSPFLESGSFPMSQHQVAKVLELQLQHHLLFWLNCD